MPLVHAQYLPHGNIILDPSGYYPQLKPDTQTCHDAMLEACRAAKATNPDLIVLTFPHGITCDDEFTIYANNDYASGNGEWLGEWKEFGVKVTIDKKATNAVSKTCNAKGLRMARLTTNGAGPTVDAVLRWSEVVPIWFLEKVFEGKVPYVLIQNPESASWMDPAGKKTELRAFGDIFYDMCKPGGPLADRRIFLAVSGDQSHVLDHPHKDLKLGLGYKAIPYGVHPAGPAFDTAVRKWCTSLDPADFEAAYPHMKEAKTCGAAGLTTLARIVERLKADGVEVTGKVLAEIAPTYYGMLVATFTLVGFDFDAHWIGK
ncbi:hypothetical protein DFJ74DRAFT_704386 [Hyaloraphidium curvatum]|nr:hypothetical protein DFJ74DRAFT_704386 [Hyaloraphidium curvatum]